MPLTGIDPLHIEVVGGDFEYDDKNKRHKAEGTMLIGLEPAAGQVFEPYVSLAGLAWYDLAILHMEGTFDLARGSFHPTLYQGVLEYQVGKAASKPVTGTPTPPPPENAFKVAGAGVHITGIRFGVDGLGLQGAIVLPDKFGGLQLLVQDRNWLLVDRNGDISLTGIKLSKKEFSITFFPKPPGEESKPDIVAKNMSVEWVAATATQPSKFVFRGEVSIPKMWDLTANFAGENYIQYANGQLDWKGRLSLGSLEIVKGRWELKEAYIEMDTIKQEYKGGGQMLIPAGFIVGGDVGFRKGRFNYVSVKVDDLNWPIGTTGWFLQRIKGEVDHLAKGGADPDPEPIAFGGGVSFSSFKFTVSESELSDVLEYFFDIDPGSQPPPEGGDEKQYEFGLAQIDVDAKIDEKRLTGDGKLYLLFMGDPSDPTKEPTAAVKATVNAEYDWIQQTLTAKGTFNLLGDLAVANGSLTVDKDGNVRIAGSGAAKLPNIPWTPLKGQTLGTGNLNARFTNDGDLTNDYVALWGTLDLGRVLGRQDVGVKIPFRGKTQFFGNLAELQRATASVSSVPQTLSASASPGDGYEIAPGTEKTVLYLEWENDVGPRAIEVVAPDGTVSSESQIAASADMSLVDAFCGATSKAVGILNPAAGVWRIRPVDSTGLGAVSSMGLGSSQPPTVTITGAYSLGNIRWTASDPDSPYHVDFFLDTDNTGADGVALTSSDGISFDRRDIPPGEYWVYAVANDGSNPPVIAYAPNSVTRKNSAPHFYGEWVGNPYFFYSVRAGDTLSTWVQAADYDPVGRPDHTSLLTFSLAPGAPPGASITPEGLLTYTTDPNRLGSYSVSITLQVTDGLPEALGPNSNTATIQVDVVGPHTVSGAIDEPDQSDAWHIAGLAGQQFVYTPAANTSASLQVTLTAPDGSVVYQGPANVSAPLAMTADGIYTVTISGEAAGDTGTYEFSLRQVIRAGEAVEDCFFDSQNKTVEYLFSATAGQMVFLQDLKTHRGHDLGSFGAQWDLVAPDGTKLSLEDMFVHGGGYRLDQSGQYRLRVTALGELVSWYSFRLADRAAATPVNAGEEVNFRFSDENDVHLFSYTGKAGDWIEIQNYDPRAGGRWWIGLPGAGRVFDPYGNRIGGDPSRLLLPEDSSLLLALRWTGIWYSTDGGKFRILRSVPQSQPLVFDQVLEDGGGFGPGQIQLEQFTFSGTAGQVVYYSELAQSPAIKTLLGPDGLVATWERDRLLVLPTTGDYSLYINRQYNHRAFKMTDVSALPSLARDTWIADMSPPAGPGLVNIYRYHGTQGEAIHLRMKESTFRTPWIIFGPDGNVLAADGDDFSAYLPATGDYTLTFPGYYGLWGKEAGYP
jgi:hypothetical protein